MNIFRKDIAVVGLGAFGSAALWRLAARGADIAGIERHGIGHHLGSSHGVTRLFRIACQEHPGLAAIALKSLGLWTCLEGQAGQALVRQTGCLNVGPPESRAVRGTLAAAAEAGVPVTPVSHEELAARQPQYGGLAPRDMAVWDPGAGICYAERVVRAQADAARRLGAVIYPHTMVTSIEADRDGVTVRTPTAGFRVSQVIVAAGAWLGSLVPGLPLSPRRTPLYWFSPRDPASREFTLQAFPAFVWERPDGGSLWGHGAAADFAIKIGPGSAGGGPGAGKLDPEGMDRYIHAGSDLDRMAALVAGAFPGLDPRPASAMPCVVTDSPDGQFIVGRLGAMPRVIVAGGDSGHGFKHAAGIGELLAQIAAGEPAYCDAGFLDPGRLR
jgi:sarcosine oxidase